MTPVGDTGSGLRPVHCEPDTRPTIKPSDPDYYCGLPVGLSRATVAMVTPPQVGESADAVGFTCAGCHTGELHHRGTAIRVEGATNIVDVTQFQSALGASLALTQRFPFRFSRFADRVLKARGLAAESPDYSVERDKLRKGLDAFLSTSQDEILTAYRMGLYASHPGGFGRTDALARIGNMVFGTEMDRDGNLAVGSAPVKFPSIWDAPYFSWAQYNGSVEQSMVRNVGEALGVRARVAYNPGGRPWGRSGEQEAVLTSTVDMPGLYAFETLLRGAGDDYFNGLRSPVWPEAHLGRIDWPQAVRGQQLYQTHCQGCHLSADRRARRGRGSQVGAGREGTRTKGRAGPRRPHRPQLADRRAPGSHLEAHGTGLPTIVPTCLGRSRRRRSRRPSTFWTWTRWTSARSGPTPGRP